MIFVMNFHCSIFCFTTAFYVSAATLASDHQQSTDTEVNTEVHSDSCADPVPCPSAALVEDSPLVPGEDLLADPVKDPLVDPVKDPLALDEPLEHLVNGDTIPERIEVKEELSVRDDAAAEKKTSDSQSNPSNPEEKTDNSLKTDNVKQLVVENQDKLNSKEKWSFEDIEKLLNFVSKVCCI